MEELKGLNGSAKNSHKRKRPDDRPSHTRTVAACDACRVSKTRCNSARPTCAQCLKRGRACVYPDTDPSSRFEVWGQRILTAIENQGRQLSDLAQVTRDGNQRPRPAPRSYFPYLKDDDLETLSRKDVLSTPITAGDVILNWSVFPKDKLFKTFPATAYIAKPNPYDHEECIPSPERVAVLREVFISEIQNKCPILDADQLDACIDEAQKTGFARSASTCLVLLILAIGAFWGKWPNDERHLVDGETGKRYTVAAPEHRLREASVYFAMAKKHMSAAFEDDTLLGALCACFFGTWYQYNIEPIQGWKMWRTASMLWEAYNLKHSQSIISRPQREKSLEQRIYWVCLKAECEIRHELPDLPTSSLQESAFPFSLPTFPEEDDTGTSPYSQDEQLTPSSHYYFLAEISLRRLLNRTRHAVTGLWETIDSFAAAKITDTLRHLQDQLQQWLECLPAALQFNIPPESWPAPEETELIKLMRERYVEVCELLCRGYLYICLHGGTRLTQDQMQIYGAQASAGLRLSIYRIRTEMPFFRHAGSWMACRVRFNQALCLIAAARGKELGVASAVYVDVPLDWRECVGLVQERLEIWSDQGGGIPEMAQIVRWLVSGE